MLIPKSNCLAVLDDGHLPLVLLERRDDPLDISRDTALKCRGLDDRISRRGLRLRFVSRLANACRSLLVLPSLDDMVALSYDCMLAVERK